jgi:hypothetical protein
MVTSNSFFGQGRGPNVIALSMKLIAGRTPQEYNQCNLFRLFDRGESLDKFLALYGNSPE